MERIDEDLDLHAKKKKLLRLADAEFLAGQTLDLAKLQLQLRELQIAPVPETGRRAGRTQELRRADSSPTYFSLMTFRVTGQRR